jgi:hypothetical protein
MDPGAVNLRRGPEDLNYVGGGNLGDDEVEMESEWLQCAEFCVLLQKLV